MKICHHVRVVPQHFVLPRQGLKGTYGDVPSVSLYNDKSHLPSGCHARTQYLDAATTQGDFPEQAGHHQTWKLPYSSSFYSMGSGLSIISRCALSC